MKLKTKVVKYSEIRKKLNILPEKEKDNGLAHLTHFLQNADNGVSHYFKESAIQYLSTIDLVEEPEIQYLLPIKWDVPFPIPEKPKFKFIDLFAGIGGIRLAFQNQGGKCVYTSEWDKFRQAEGHVPVFHSTSIPNAIAS